MDNENKNINSQATGDNYPYYSPAPSGEFPIIGYPLKYNNGSQEIPANSLKTLKEANFTVGMQQALTASAFSSSFENATSYGLKLIIGNSSFFKETGSNYSNVVKYASLGGFFLKDEPSYSDISSTSSTLYSDYKVMMDRNPSHLVYINLFGVEDSRLENHTLTQYVNKFQEIFKPSYFSYDFYPITEICNLLTGNTTEQDSEGKINVDYDNFYNALQIFSNISKVQNRPFWAFCESMSYVSLKYKNYRPIALEQFLRFEAFSALAFGAKGIVYWTYAMTPNSSENATAYLSSILDRRDQPTASWYFAQEINAEIKKYSYIFINSILQECVQTGIKRGNIKEFSSNPVSPFESIESDKEDGIIISSLSSNHQDYLIMVNKSVEDYQTVEFTYKPSSNRMLYEVTPLSSDGEVNPKFLPLTFSRTFIPGGYRILQLK